MPHTSMTELYLLTWKKQRAVDFPQEEHNVFVCSKAVALSLGLRFSAQRVKT